MTSHEVLKKSVADLGAKAVASELNLSTSLIYKWCQPTDSEDASGADNPLDRVAQLYEITEDTRPINWLCHKANGYFVPNVSPREGKPVPLLHMTRRIVREFSDLLDVITISIENDGKIDLAEAETIRKEWEELKSVTESFVVSCEKGMYAD